MQGGEPALRSHQNKCATSVYGDVGGDDPEHQNHADAFKCHLFAELSFLLRRGIHAEGA